MDSERNTVGRERLGGLDGHHVLEGKDRPEVPALTQDEPRAHDLVCGEQGGDAKDEQDGGKDRPEETDDFEPHGDR